MSKRSQLSVAPYRLGEVKYFNPGTNPILIDPNGGRWLRTGYLTNYAAVYDPLLAECPGMGIRAMPALEPTFVSSYMGYGAKLFYYSGNYGYLGGNTSGNSYDYRYGPATSMQNSWGNPTTHLSGVTCALRFSASRTLLLGFPQSAAYGVIWSDAFGVWNAPSTGIAANAVFTYGAANGAGHAVIFQNNAQTNSTGYIYTTADGGNYTSRTGTGGNSDFVQGCYWSPCSAAYLIPCGAASGPTKMNKAADGYTQTACTLPAGVVFNAGDSWEKFHASSPTATLILLKDGRVLRTTDGNTFSVVDPAATAGYPASSATAIGYDSVNSRFLIGIGSGNSGRPMFIYSDDQGLTWKASTAFDDYTNGYLSTPSMIATVNGKVLICMRQSAASNTGNLADFAAVPLNSPQYVGTTVNVSQQQGSTNFYTHAYIRVKN